MLNSDEIATATPAMRSNYYGSYKILVEPVGSTQTRQVDTRVILATHENLKTVRCGKFRETFTGESTSSKLSSHQKERTYVLSRAVSEK